MSSQVEQIKDKLSIVDVVSSYVKLEKAGKNFKAACPFHNEKTPSFFVSPERSSYYCFGCGAKGDIFNFVESFEGQDFRGALKILAERAGVELEKIDPQKVSDLERMRGLLEQAAQYFQDNLKNEAPALEYLQKRAVNEESIQTFRLGFAKDDWHALHETFKGKGYTDDELIRVGLIKKGEQGRIYDTFRSRIMFPIMDTSGRVIAFSGRIFGKEDPAKYLNTPETEFFIKSNVLYGYDKAKFHMHRLRSCIVVEGQLDVILAHQVHYRNTVAPLGTALTPEHLRTIQRLTSNMLLALDADPAGVASVARSTQLALARGFDVKVAALPQNSDPADLIGADQNIWKDVVRNAEHIVHFLLKIYRENQETGREFAKYVTSDILPFVAEIENKLEQAHFVKEIANALNVTETVVYEELLKVHVPTAEEKVAESPGDATERQKQTRRENILRKLLGAIAWQSREAEKTLDVEALKARISAVLGAMPEIPEGAEEEYIFEAEAMFEDSPNISTHIEEMLLLFEQEELENTLSTLMAKLTEAEQGKDPTKALEILKQCKDVSSKIETVKQKIQEVQT